MTLKRSRLASKRAAEDLEESRPKKKRKVKWELEGLQQAVL